METNDNKLYHQFIVRLDDDMSNNLYNHADQYDMTLTGIFRHSLKLYFKTVDDRLDCLMQKKQSAK
jgi:hypothetical protein